MSTISGTQGYQTYTAQRPPPSGKDRLASAIGDAASTGALSQTDATALTSALDTIDQGLSADRTASGGAARLDPAEMQDRIGDLIADQVSSGALTEDQADMLSDLFGQLDEGGPDGPGGGGPPPGPPPGGTDAATSDTSASDLLATFIDQLKSAQTSGAGYAASGRTGGQQASALLFDFKA
ncbi:hypothetical protein [Methylobacterium radiodurans]|uniref:Uncharacterized protein n=1 Tax=Methylobacterium radiodurans TaxID=2202828 RepID=A0A2U8W061_9HYPH|nr:hypothetical protein [Methylobacterium radiodurans]AWN38870.1 hypothetical protein DK427_05690 [Methylobacterium radiodurans]